MPKFERGDLVVLFVGLVILSLFGWFVWLRVTSPFDGARLPPGVPAWRSGGLLIRPVDEHPGGLRPGDLVVALNGRNLESWAQSLFRPGSARAKWQIGQTITYTIVRAGRQIEVKVELGRYPLGAILAEAWGLLLFGLANLVVAVIIFVKSQLRSVARVYYLTAVSVLGSTTWAFGLQVNDLTNWGIFWLFYVTTTVAYLLIWLTTLHFGLIFPQRHPLARRFSWLLPAVYIIPYLIHAVYILVLRARPISALAWFSQSETDIGFVQLVYLVLAVAVVVSGYRKLDSEASRKQLRWVVYAFVLVMTISVLLGLLPEFIRGVALVSWNVIAFIALLIPLAMAIAILRYQLFDIDLIINRTLVYGLLTGILGLVYLGSVVSLQQLFRVATGQSSPIAIVASTLAITVLFNPLRKRIQDGIDRRFYRRKYDVAQTLATFSRAMQNEVDLERLAARLRSPASSGPRNHAAGSCLIMDARRCGNSYRSWPS
jgi:two-component system NarL family sensor kinase